MDNPSAGQPTITPTPLMATPHTEQIITYTPFLKTASVSEGAYGVAPNLYFTYGTDYQRILSSKWSFTRAPGNTFYRDEKLFLGNYEEQNIDEDGGGSPVWRKIHYINGGNGLCATIVFESHDVGSYAEFTSSQFFLYTDYLGSILTVTDKLGTIIANQNFDAWGRYRNPDNWQQYVTTFTPEYIDAVSWLYRGYTGHEMLPEFNLINMNGRMYDPILGRMLSPDNYVPTPYGTQGYNRYSYAMNNPLSYVDPDGNFPAVIIAAALIGGFVKGSMNIISGTGGFWGGFWKGAIVGGVGGGLSLIGGGSFLANMAWGVGEGVAVNGLSHVLNGNPFFQGGGKAALLAGVFSVVTSGIEAYKNWQDGYGFGTNTGRLDKMVDDYSKSIGTSNELTNANRAIGFVQKRYDLGAAFFSYNPTLSAYGRTFKATGLIDIGKRAFISSSMLKATMIHEYWHATVDRFTGLLGAAEWNYGDGIGAYSSEIMNSGRMHISSSALSKVTFSEGEVWSFGSKLIQGSTFTNPVWYANGVVNFKWWFQIPKRF